MDENGRGILGNWDATSEEIREALGHAISAALREHKRAGRSVVMWDREHDRIMIVPPDEIVIPDDAPANGDGDGRSGDQPASIPEAKPSQSR